MLALFVRNRCFGLLTVMLFFALAGCGTPPPDAITEDATPEESSVSNETDESKNLIDAGKRATPATRDRILAAKDALFDALSGRLMTAIQSEGAAAAIGVCKDEASVITESIAAEHGVRIGRSGVRLRNPANGAPEWATEFVEDGTADPQFVVLRDGSTAALLPILLKPQCLQCHGPEDQLADDVRLKLAHDYSDDAATGFRTGDLRGWFWVEVPPEPSA